MSAVSMMSLMPTGTPCSGPTPLPSLRAGVGGPGLLQRALAVEEGPGLDLRLELGDALEAGADQLLGAKLAAGNPAPPAAVAGQVGRASGRRSSARKSLLGATVSRSSSEVVEHAGQEQGEGERHKRRQERPQHRAQARSRRSDACVPPRGNSTMNRTTVSANTTTAALPSASSAVPRSAALSCRCSSAATGRSAGRCRASPSR